MFGTTPSYTPTASAVAATLADIYDPTIFNAGVQEKAIELNAFVQSGIMQLDATINAMASGPGSTGDLPFFYGLSNVEPNYSSDDPAARSTPKKIGSGKQVYRSAHMNESWSTMDLARELGLQDPLGAIIDRVAGFWAVNNEKRLINTCQGVMLDNIANDAGDMVNAIHSETAAGAGPTTVIQAGDIVDTVATLGDHASMISAIAMHSVVKRNLEKQQLISTIRDSDNNIMFDVYLGKYRVIEDDSLVARAGVTDGFVYTTILFAAGAVAYGQGTPMVPSEMERKPDTGNGGGQDVLYSRATEIIHPYGFAFADAGLAGLTPTYAELAAAAQWDRVFQERKNIGLAFLTSNG